MGLQGQDLGYLRTRFGCSGANVGGSWAKIGGSGVRIWGSGAKIGGSGVKNGGNRAKTECSLATIEASWFEIWAGVGGCGAQISQWVLWALNQEKLAVFIY